MGPTEPTGRANIDGTAIDLAFIPDGGREGLAVDDEHIYWTKSHTLGAGRIGRSDLDGSNPDPNFITGLNRPHGIAIDDGHIYWTDIDAGTIGRANLDGTGVNASFMTGFTLPTDVAVTSQVVPPDPDTDGDGILDSVDPDPGTASDGFDDGAGTAGSITDRAGLAVTIEDLTDPDGVRVVVGSGSGKVTLSVCGGSIVKVSAGSEVELTCGSVTLDVIDGAAEVVLGGGATVVTVPTGASATVSENPDGSYAVDNLGAVDVTVTVDGIATTVGPGDSADFETWDFQGFTSPVDNPPVDNVANAGQAIPLRWRLVSASGAPVTTLASAQISATSLACELGSTDDLEETSPGASGLQNLGNGYYQLNWKTPKGYAKSCKALHLDLGEGITRDAHFRFKK